MFVLKEQHMSGYSVVSRRTIVEASPAPFYLSTKGQANVSDREADSGGKEKIHMDLKCAFMVLHSTYQLQRMTSNF